MSNLQPFLSFCWLRLPAASHFDWTLSCLTESIYCPGLIREWSTEQKKRCFIFQCQHIAMLRIPNYAIISHRKDSQQHRNWPLFHSVPTDAVWIKQQHVCSHTALTVWRHCSFVSLSVSVVCVNWCFFCSVNLIISLVSFGAKGQQFWRNHLGSQEL